MKIKVSKCGKKAFARVTVGVLVRKRTQGHHYNYSNIIDCSIYYGGLSGGNVDVAQQLLLAPILHHTVSCSAKDTVSKVTRSIEFTVKCLLKLLVL